MSKSQKVKEESLERLKNQLEQAKTDGNTDLVKKIEAVIARIKGGRMAANQSYMDKTWKRHQARMEEESSKNALNRELLDGKIIDESGAMPKSAGADAVQEARNAAESGTMNPSSFAQSANAAASAAGQGNEMGTAGSTLMAAGAIPSPASPYLMAAGLGLQVLGAGEQNRRNQEEAQRRDYNERIAKRQEAMARIASMGIQ